MQEKLLKLKKGSKVTLKKSCSFVKRKPANTDDDTPTRRTSRKQTKTESGFYIRC